MLHPQSSHYLFAALTHAKALMANQSITPNDNGCQDYLIAQLSQLGFHCESHLINGVSNLIARWGEDKPNNRHIAFAGHTDVVPPGPIERWVTDPFTPSINDGVLF